MMLARTVLIGFVIFSILSGCTNKELIPRPTPADQPITSSIQISSKAFASGQSIPEKYSCNGENLSPPLTIGAAPDRAKTFVLIVDDPDAPRGPFTHWIIWNIDRNISDISENTTPPGSVSGLNSANKTGYTGPCPPAGTHHYQFNIYALDTRLALAANSNRKQLEAAMAGHIIANGELVGTFSK